MPARQLRCGSPGAPGMLALAEGRRPLCSTPDLFLSDSVIRDPYAARAMCQPLLAKYKFSYIRDPVSVCLPKHTVCHCQWWGQHHGYGSGCRRTVRLVTATSLTAAITKPSLPRGIAKPNGLKFPFHSNPQN